MKKHYSAPTAESYLLCDASFLATSGEPGDAIAADIFDGDYGNSF